MLGMNHLRLGKHGNNNKVCWSDDLLKGKSQHTHRERLSSITNTTASALAPACARFRNSQTWKIEVQINSVVWIVGIIKKTSLNFSPTE